MKLDFDWDPDKHERNVRERGIGFDGGARIIRGPTCEWEDKRRNYNEKRFRAVGKVDGDALHVVYTDRVDARRIISVRKAHTKKRQRWQSMFG